MKEKKFTAKGKEMFNIMVKQFGKKKARSLFYSLERNRPYMVEGWRED
jgi:hypothetical protein